MPNKTDWLIDWYYRKDQDAKFHSHAAGTFPSVEVAGCGSHPSGVNSFWSSKSILFALWSVIIKVGKERFHYHPLTGLPRWPKPILLTSNFWRAFAILWLGSLSRWKFFQSFFLNRNDTSFSFNNQLYSDLALSSWAYFIPTRPVNTPRQLVSIRTYSRNWQSSTIQSLTESCLDICITVSLCIRLAFSSGAFTSSRQFMLSWKLQVGTTFGESFRVHFPCTAQLGHATTC